MNFDPAPWSQLAKNCCRDLFKSLTCLLLSITVCESMKLFGMFYFWCLHTLPIFSCLALLVLPSFLFIIHSVHSHQKVTAGCMNGVSWPHRLPCITNALASGWTIGSPGPGMQGMVQRTIRRKFPAVRRKLRNNSAMCNNWKKK